MCELDRVGPPADQLCLRLFGVWNSLGLCSASAGSAWCWLLQNLLELLRTWASCPAAGVQPRTFLIRWDGGFLQPGDKRLKAATGSGLWTFWTGSLWSFILRYLIVVRVMMRLVGGNCFWFCFVLPAGRQASKQPINTINHNKQQINKKSAPEERQDEVHFYCFINSTKLLLFFIV